MGVGTYLERFAAKFCVEPRRECLKIFYGDPFGAKFVPNWLGQGSGASSFTFSLDLGLDLGLDLDLDLDLDMDMDMESGVPWSLWSPGLGT